jgi:hypothetical protein
MKRFVKDLPLSLFEVCEVFTRFCGIVVAFNPIIYLNSDFFITAWFLKATMYSLLKILGISNTLCGIRSLNTSDLKDKIA